MALPVDLLAIPSFHSLLFHFALLLPLPLVASSLLPHLSAFYSWG